MCLRMCARLLVLALKFAFANNRTDSAFIIGGGCNWNALSNVLACLCARRSRRRRVFTVRVPCSWYRCSRSSGLSSKCWAQKPHFILVDDELAVVDGTAFVVAELVELVISDDVTSGMCVIANDEVLPLVGGSTVVFATGVVCIFVVDVVILVVDGDITVLLLCVVAVTVVVIGPDPNVDMIAEVPAVGQFVAVAENLRMPLDLHQ